MSRTRSAIEYVIDRSLLLVVGTVVALVWANLDVGRYARFADALQFGVNDVGMVFFFALAAKEVFEATLPGGALSSPRRAALPLLAAVGGMLVPAAIYIATVRIAAAPELARGWAVPCATDIAFSYLVARLAFGSRHPAIPFLLLLAISDDALGLVILALFYPTTGVSLVRFAMFMVPAVAVAGWLRRRGTASFWPFVVGAGALSWWAFHTGGFHPALALVPIVPFMPHAVRDLGLFDTRKELRADTLDRFERWWRPPVQGILFLFGLVNAGVAVSSIGLGTWAVMGALLVGKPVGIITFVMLATFAGLHRPEGVKPADVLVLGAIAGIGFTVSLFFATAAFPAGAQLEQAKLGALLSFAAAPIGLTLARLVGVQRIFGGSASSGTF